MIGAPAPPRQPPALRYVSIHTQLVPRICARATNTVGTQEKHTVQTIHKIKNTPTSCSMFNEWRGRPCMMCGLSTIILLINSKQQRQRAAIALSREGLAHVRIRPLRGRRAALARWPGHVSAVSPTRPNHSPVSLQRPVCCIYIYYSCILLYQQAV